MSERAFDNTDIPLRRIHVLLAIIVIIVGLAGQVIAATLWVAEVNNTKEQTNATIAHLNKRLDVFEAWVERHKELHTEQVGFFKDMVYNMQRLMEKNGVTYKTLEVKGATR